MDGPLHQKITVSFKTRVAKTVSEHNKRKCLTTNNSLLQQSLVQIDIEQSLSDISDEKFIKLNLRKISIEQFLSKN